MIAPVWLGGKVVVRVTTIFILSSEAVWDPITAQLRLNAATWWGARELTSWTTAWTSGCTGRLHTCKDQTQQEHFLMLWVTYKLYITEEKGKINVSLQVVKYSWAKHDISLFTSLYRNPKYRYFKISRTVFIENLFIVVPTDIYFEYFPWPVLKRHNLFIFLTDLWWPHRPSWHYIKSLWNTQCL